MRRQASCNIVLSDRRSNNCLGLDPRLRGQRRVPLPPAMIKTYNCYLHFG